MTDRSKPNPSITEAADALCAMREWLPGCEELVARFMVDGRPMEMVITHDSDVELYSEGVRVPMKKDVAA